MLIILYVCFISNPIKNSTLLLVFPSYHKLDTAKRMIQQFCHKIFCLLSNEAETIQQLHSLLDNQPVHSLCYEMIMQHYQTELFHIQKYIQLIHHRY